MNKTRRLLVNAVGSGIVAFPILSLLGSTRLQAADHPKLDPDDAVAKSLNYTHESADTARRCAGCQFYTGAKGEDWGPCVIFPEKLVNANGVYNSWYARAG
jgi:hypothetical protein